MKPDTAWLQPTRPTHPGAAARDKAYASSGNRTELRRREVKTVIPEPADQAGHRKRQAV